MIDLHCHVLPGIDDGPRGLQDALDLARAHVDAGVDEVAATSHVLPRLPNDADSLAAAVATLRDALARADIPLTVWPGAEIGLSYAVTLPDAELRRLALGDGPWLLIEAPLSETPGVDVKIAELMVRGHQVLLGHPERCPAFQRDPRMVGRLVHDGALVQVTAGAFVGHFGRTAQRLAARLAADGLVHVVASDAHDVVARPPGMRADLEDAGLAAHAAWWTEEVPAAVLAGDPIPSRPVTRRRRWRVMR